MCQDSVGLLTFLDGCEEAIGAQERSVLAGAWLWLQPKLLLPELPCRMASLCMGTLAFCSFHLWARGSKKKETGESRAQAPAKRNEQA